MLSVESPRVLGSRPGRHGGGSSDGGSASLSDSDEEGGSNPRRVKNDDGRSDVA